MPVMAVKVSRAKSNRGKYSRQMRRRKTIRLRRRGEDKDMKFNLRPLLKNNYPELGIIGNGFQAM
jgi:hypothetical protein